MGTAAVQTRGHEATQAVVFDLGGVLVNWQPPRLIQSIWPDRAPTEDRAREWAQAVFQSFVPGSAWSEFDRGALPPDEVARRIAERIGVQPAEMVRLMDAIAPHLAPMQPTVQWLQELAAAGTRLHFLSNMPAPFVAHLRQHHRFLDLFHSGVFSCDVGQVKPQAEIFETAARQLGLRPEVSVFIDDHVANVETARTLGWRAVLFKDAAQCRDELRERGWL